MMTGPFPNFMDVFLKIYLNADDPKLQKRLLYSKPVCYSWKFMACMMYKDANMKCLFDSKQTDRQKLS